MRSSLIRMLVLTPALLLSAAQAVAYAQPQNKPSGAADSFEGMVDVGGYKLYVRCAGERRGPTVVLEAGASSPSSDWDKVAPEVARFARVCRYDRANIGKSEAAPKPRPGSRVVKDLHTLLCQRGEPAPYVLVGHSLGGIFSVFYAALYPHEVAGMVLVDSSHEAQVKRFESLMTAEQREQSRARLASLPEGVDSVTLREQVGALRWRADIPLIVLAHGAVNKDMIPPGWSQEQLDARERIWRELQQDYSRRSQRGELIVAEKSGHYIQNDQPELVIEAVRRVVEAVRKQKPAPAKPE